MGPSQGTPRTPRAQQPAQPRLARPPARPQSPLPEPLSRPPWAGRPPGVRPPRRPQQTPAAPPALGCAQPGPARVPTPQLGAVSVGRTGRSSSGLFECRWLPHPPSPAPEFLCWFQTQRLGARAAPGSVPNAPRRGGGGGPEDPRALAPVGGLGRRNPAWPHHYV